MEKDKFILTIDEHFRIEADALNYTLFYEEKYTSDGKTKTSKDMWYYPNLKLAISQYVTQKTALSCPKEATEILALLNKIDETIKNLKI